MQTIRQRARTGQSGIRFFMRFFQYAVMVMAIGVFSIAGAAEKVNLNLADAETLEYIPGIGPGKATDIIKLRQQNGGFKSFEDLLEVRGIGVKTLEDVKKYATLNGGVSKISQEMRDNPPSKNSDHN
ncbi:ComEA family DNA-binding protein [Candidatus Spongiihabitans sp.]|uniref:ComEA family DNA-binding protein n=1 Tax=Candidatus Spongiihabitans sp. TaxID=3101308 RepID=UPI003C6FB36F